MPDSLADLIAASGRTPTQLAAATGIPAETWQHMATAPNLLTHGQPWRPNPGIVATIARALDVSETAVRSAIVTSSPDTTTATAGEGGRG